MNDIRELTDPIAKKKWQGSDFCSGHRGML